LATLGANKFVGDESLQIAKQVSTDIKLSVSGIWFSSVDLKQTGYFVLNVGYLLNNVTVISK